ncbi:NBR1-Ig-like domain-containing protein [Nonomuraea sp. NPDC049309]|uniref:NBR1-Ig-like domain-containing protein n=1 Tax=Nonomuraea sp. NPDC049309 TaxID=3364350 RepID=UPI00371FD705
MTDGPLTTEPETASPPAAGVEVVSAVSGVDGQGGSSGAGAALSGDKPARASTRETLTPGPEAGPCGRRALLAAGIAAAGVVAVLVGWLLPTVTDDGSSRAAPTEAATTGTAAPTATATPATTPGTTPAAEQTPAASASPRDDSVFEQDVTYPDGSVVRAGQRFDKTWRIRNAGEVHWHDRYLTRMNDTPCKAPKRVGIGPVRPGESVDITVRVRAAKSPGRCKIYWKMTDEDGTPLLADKRPIFLDVTVA